MTVNNYENYEVALNATAPLINAIPLLGGSNRRDDYEQALEIVERLIDTDDENPLIDLLAKKSLIMRIQRPNSPNLTRVLPPYRRSWRC